MIKQILTMSVTIFLSLQSNSASAFTSKDLLRTCSKLAVYHEDHYYPFIEKDFHDMRLCSEMLQAFFHKHNNITICKHKDKMKFTESLKEYGISPQYDDLMVVGEQAEMVAKYLNSMELKGTDLSKYSTTMALLDLYARVTPCTALLDKD